MKSQSRFLFATVACLVPWSSKGEAADPSSPLRNVWMRTVPRNATEISVGSRIHGGARAAEGQFKFMVFLLSYRSAGYDYPEATCSASLIHPNWVLTAAHCVSPAMIAVAGRADLYGYWQDGRRLTPYRKEIREMEFGVQERKVSRIFVHPGYSTITNEKDLALLLLDEAFDIESDHRAPVTVLPLSASQMSREMRCTVLGWGLDDHRTQTFRLMYASEIRAKTPALGCHYLKTGPFVCLEEGGAGICRGDSGSPLVCEGEGWGVASFSLTPGSTSDSSSTAEEYYSQTFPELEWIKKTMSNGGIYTTCVTTFPFVLGLINFYVAAS